MEKESTLTNLAKVRFQSGTKTVELEGSEDFVREMWSTIQQLSDQDPTPIETSDSLDESTPKKNVKASIQPKSRISRPRGAEVERIRDLNLEGDGSLPPLDVYVEELRPSKHNERNLVFVDYLVKLGVKVTPNHVFTCYEELGELAPTAFVQSLRDTAKDKKWLDVSDMGEIRVSMNGRNYLKGMAQRGAS